MGKYCTILTKITTGPKKTVLIRIAISSCLRTRMIYTVSNQELKSKMSTNTSIGKT